MAAESTPWRDDMDAEERRKANNMALDKKRKADCRRAGVDESTLRHVLDKMAADERRKADCRRAGVDESTPRHVLNKIGCERAAQKMIAAALVCTSPRPGTSCTASLDERRKDDCRRAGVPEFAPWHALNDMAADERQRHDAVAAAVPL